MKSMTFYGLNPQCNLRSCIGTFYRWLMNNFVFQNCKLQTKIQFVLFELNCFQVHRLDFCIKEIMKMITNYETGAEHCVSICRNRLKMFHCKTVIKHFYIHSHKLLIIKSLFRIIANEYEEKLSYRYFFTLSGIYFDLFQARFLIINC